MRGRSSATQPAPARRKRLCVIAAAASASIGVPAAVLLRHHSSTSDCSGGGGLTDGKESAAALRTLALLAKKNADALRELSESSEHANDRDVLDTIEHAVARAQKSGNGHLATGATASTFSQAGGAGSSTGAASSGCSEGALPVWLRFAIVSIARRNDADYLLRTIHSILEQLPATANHPVRASTDMVIVNNNDPPEQHAAFHAASARFAGRAKFVNKAILDPPLACPGTRRGGSRTATPKPAVQRQSCDLVAAFRALLSVHPAAVHLILLEDDWLLCPHGLLAINHAIDKAYTYDRRWLALRVSYGFNGVIVPQADLPSLTDHLASHFSRRPPDHLLFEWFSGERPETRCAPVPLRVPCAAYPMRMRIPWCNDGNKSTLMYTDMWRHVRRIRTTEYRC